MSSSIGTREFEVVVSGDRLVRISIDGPLQQESGFKDILFIPGFKGFKDWGGWPWFCSELAVAGHRVFRMNPSMCGVGPSLDTFDQPERFARQTLAHDVEDVQAVLADDELGISAPILLGHSRGGLVAALSARVLDGVSAVITMGTPTDLVRISEQELKQWRADGRREIVNARTGEVLYQDVEVLEDYLQQGDAYSAPLALQEAGVAVLAIHGAEDEAVDFASAEVLLAGVDSQQARKIIVAGAGHTFGLTHPFTGPHPHAQKVIEEILSWLGEDRR
ncbi:MAG: alpha/beta fold hydrolase [Planctomycetota bacterium]|nr:alpha/beta fold hydrolase [Planctomycetota bacterium]